MNRKLAKEQTVLFLILAAVSAGFVYYFSGSTSPIISDYYGDDSAVFQVVGKSWKNGTLPYVGVFDHKGPLIFLINALGYLLGAYGMMIVQWAFMVAAFYGIFKIAALFMGYKSSLLVSLLSYFVLVPTYGFGNYTEEYSLVFLAFSIYFGIKYFLKLDWNKEETLKHPWTYAVWYGTSFMCILLMRVTNALAICCIIFLVLCILLRYKMWKNIWENVGGFLLGCLIVFAPFAIYFACNGALYDMIYGTLIHNVLYVSDSSIFTEIGASWRSVCIALFTTILLMVVSIVYIFVCKGRQWILGAYGIMASGTAILMFIGINRYLHYYMISVPFFALAVGLTVKMKAYTKEHIMKRLVFYGACAAILIQVALGAARAIRQSHSNYVFAEYAKAYKGCYEQLMSQVPEEEQADFLTFGSNALSQWYLLGDIEPSYKYCFSQGWMSSCSSDMKEEITTYLEQEPAKWLVVDADFDTEEMLENDGPEYVSMIKERYELVDTAKMNNDFKCFQLYKRK